MTVVSPELMSRVDSVRWHHSYEIVPGVTSKGTYDPNGLWKRLKLGREISGKRILDLGTRDGFFSFQCEALGASVLATDYVPKEATGFGVASEIRGSSVEFLHQNLYELRASDIGTFDYVLMLGLIYHLPDPYLALEIARSLVKPGGVVFVESTCIDQVAVLSDTTVDTSSIRDLPIMMFVARNKTSFWDLNSKCLTQLLEHTGFIVRDMQRWGKRMLARAEAIDNPKMSRLNADARGVVQRG